MPRTLNASTYIRRKHKGFQPTLSFQSCWSFELFNCQDMSYCKSLINSRNGFIEKLHAVNCNGWLCYVKKEIEAFAKWPLKNFISPFWNQPINEFIHITNEAEYLMEYFATKYLLHKGFMLNKRICRWHFCCCCLCYFFLFCERT